uniref:CerR family C-terminal domain-containing protein n=1 Tax=Ningiella ruwaisensis TaxID=2364274 RepID=UPI0010A001D3|nr:CerR family C-terminal domain-containing protein [Ningiella ruwaisensis]
MSYLELAQTQRSMITDDIRNSSTAISLIEAGIEQFGLYGLKATTRSVVEKAKANIAAIPYYFRNKKGLYLACMHYIVDEIWAELGEGLGEGLGNELGKQLNQDSSGLKLNKAQSKAAYLNIMDRFCEFFLKDPKTQRWAQLIMREHASPTEAYNIFYRRYYQHMQGFKAKLLACCLGKDENDPRVKVQSHALFGQAISFLVARESLIRGLGKEDLDAQDIDMIREVIREQILAILGAD